MLQMFLSQDLDTFFNTCFLHACTGTQVEASWGTLIADTQTNHRINSSLPNAWRVNAPGSEFTDFRALKIRGREKLSGH